MSIVSNEAPRITIYARVISNIDNSQLQGFSDARYKKGNYSFGSVNGLTGGESSNIVEFDIWNNEPAFSAGGLAENNADAINCKFSAWDSSALANSNSIKHNGDPFYVRARNTTGGDYSKSFVAIAGARGLQTYDNQLVEFAGNETLTLSGQAGGSHIEIQTKIVVPAPENNPIGDVNKKFVFAFQYDYV